MTFCRQTERSLCRVLDCSPPFVFRALRIFFNILFKEVVEKGADHGDGPEMSKLFPSRLIAGTYNVYPEFKFKADKEPCTPRCTHASFRPESGFFRDQLATDQRVDDSPDAAACYDKDSNCLQCSAMYRATTLKMSSLAALRGWIVAREPKGISCCAS